MPCGDVAPHVVGRETNAKLVILDFFYATYLHQSSFQMRQNARFRAFCQTAPLVVCRCRPCAYLGGIWMKSYERASMIASDFRSECQPAKNSFVMIAISWDYVAIKQKIHTTAHSECERLWSVDARMVAIMGFACPRFGTGMFH